MKATKVEGWQLKRGQVVRITERDFGALVGSNIRQYRHTYVLVDSEPFHYDGEYTFDDADGWSVSVQSDQKVEVLTRDGAEDLVLEASEQEVDVWGVYAHYHSTGLRGSALTWYTGESNARKIIDAFNG